MDREGIIAISIIIPLAVFVTGILVYFWYSEFVKPRKDAEKQKKQMEEDNPVWDSRFAGRMVVGLRNVLEENIEKIIPAKPPEPSPKYGEIYGSPKYCKFCGSKVLKLTDPSIADLYVYNKLTGEDEQIKQYSCPNCGTNSNQYMWGVDVDEIVLPTPEWSVKEV